MLLTPQDPELSVASGTLQQTLREAEFIGEPLPGEQNAFFVGGRFLSLVIFAGCSVQIELRPPTDGGGFCHVRLIGPFERPTLLHGRNTRPPRCPMCRARYGDWRTLLPTAGEIERRILACPSCGAEHPPGAWDWKGNAGFGKTFILVEEIFPGEATPAPSLSAILKRGTGVPWRHFYMQDE